MTTNQKHSENSCTTYSLSYSYQRNANTHNTLTHIYTTTGTYTVTLTASCNGGSHTETKTDYITVSPITPTTIDLSIAKTDFPDPIVVTNTLTYYITATVSANEPDHDTTNNSITIQTTVTEPPQYDLVITKTTSVQSVMVNDNISYILRVSNRGPNTATNVIITDNLPNNLTFVSTIPNNACTDNNNMLTCDLGDLAKNEEQSIVITVKAIKIGKVCNTADVTFTADSEPTDNHDTVCLNINPADVWLSKDVSPLTAYVGNVFSYTIIAVNNGPAEATEIIITDTLPASLTPVQWQNNCQYDANLHELHCTVGNLIDGSNQTILYSAKATTAGIITNTVTIQANEPDPTPTNNTDYATITVMPIISITNLTITDPITGLIQSNIRLTAEMTPDNASQPLDYLWQATDHTDRDRKNQGLNDSETYTWQTKGTKYITVTTSNRAGSISKTHAITLYEPCQANFSRLPADGVAPLTIDITNLSTGDCLSYHIVVSSKMKCTMVQSAL